MPAAERLERSPQSGFPYDVLGIQPTLAGALVVVSDMNVKQKYTTRGERGSMATGGA